MITFSPSATAATSRSACCCGTTVSFSPQTARTGTQIFFRRRAFSLIAAQATATSPDAASDPPSSQGITTRPLIEGATKTGRSICNSVRSWPTHFFGSTSTAADSP